MGAHHNEPMLESKCQKRGGTGCNLSCRCSLVIVKDFAYFNGRLTNLNEMTIPMNDRAVFFGDGVYEVVYVRNGLCFALDDHVNRFFSSLRLLEIRPPMSQESLKNLLKELIGKLDKGMRDVCLYFQCTRGTALRSHAFPDSSIPPNLLIYAHAFLNMLHKEFRLISAEDRRFGYCHIKSLNLIPNVLATQRAVEAGADECVLHRGEVVMECAHSGLSILKNGKIITSPLNEWILPSITRKHLLQIGLRLGIQVEERPYMMDELMSADEVIITSSLTLLSRAYEIDGQPIGGKDLSLFGRIDDTYMNWFHIETEE